MALPIGVLLFILGAVAFFAWFSEILPFVKGIVVFSLMFWGLISALIGYSEKKGRRELKAGLHDEKITEEVSAKKQAETGA